MKLRNVEPSNGESVKPPCVLVTSGGSLSGEGIMLCLAALGARLRVVVTNSIAEAPALYDADAAYLVPPARQIGAYRARLREILATEQPDAVLAGRDDDLAPLADLATEPAMQRTRFLVPPSALVPVFNDKYSTAGFAREHGLAFAPTAASANELNDLVDQYGWPLFAKPRHGGHASKGVVLATSAAQAERLLSRGNVVFQPFVGRHLLEDPLDPWTTDDARPWIWTQRWRSNQIEFALDGRGDLVAPPVVTVSENAGALVQSLERVDHPALVEAADRTVEVMRACGHCGPCNLQGAVEADGRFVAFEWNGRFTGCAPGHALLGTNIVAALLRASVPALAQSGDEGSHDRMVRRTTVFRAMWRHDVATLRTFGRWSRDD